MVSSAKIISVVLALVFIGAGAGKLTNGFGSPDMQAFYAKGKAEWFVAFYKLIPEDAFLPLIGAAEVAGGIGLLIRQLNTLANVLLMPIMIGAIFAHVRANDTAGGVPAAVILLLQVILFVSKGKRSSAGHGKKAE